MNNKVLIPNKYVYEAFVNIFGMDENVFNKVIAKEDEILSYEEMVELNKMLEDEGIGELISIISNSDKALRVSFGGNGIIPTNFVIYDEGEMGICLVLLEDYVLISSYEDAFSAYKDLIRGFIMDESIYRGSVKYKFMDLETMIFMMHSIDCVKRAEYLDILGYSFSESKTISAHDFIETFEKSIPSFDTRWVLPALLLHNEDILREDLDFSEEKIKMMVLDDMVKLKSDGSNIIYEFNDYIKEIGNDVMENLISYLSVSLLDFNNSGDGISSIFNLVTQTTNHFFTISNIDEVKEVEYRYGALKDVEHGIIEMIGQLD